MVFLLAGCHLTGCGEGGGIQYAASKELAKLKDAKISESSGLAYGRINEGVFWTHNDSGGQPRIFAIRPDGTTAATVNVSGAKNIDWEDICSFTIDKKSYLLIADTGDNSKNRKFVTLYLIDEPRLNLKKSNQRLAAPLVQKINITYAAGPDDCEAIAVDPTSKTVVIATKGSKRVYLLELKLPAAPAKAPTTKPASKTPAAKLADETVVLKPAGKLAGLSFTPTGMDISPDGRRAVVVTYLWGYEYTRAADESWPAAFARKPRVVFLPMRKQGESICFGPDGRSLYLTSEKTPTPLIEIRAKPETKSPRLLDNKAPNTQNMQKPAGKSSPATP